MTSWSLAGWGMGAETGREGREGCAKDAKENQKIQKIFKDSFQSLKRLLVLIPPWIFFYCPLSRPSRNLSALSALRALRVQKSAFVLKTANQPRTAQ